MDLSVAFEEEDGEASLDVGRRAVRERQTVAALVVRALGHVLAAPLLVKQTRGRIGEGPPSGHPTLGLPDGVGMEHPAVAVAGEGGGHLARQHGQFLVAR